MTINNNINLGNVRPVLQLVFNKIDGLPGIHCFIRAENLRMVDIEINA